MCQAAALVLNLSFENKFETSLFFFPSDLSLFASRKNKAVR